MLPSNVFPSNTCFTNTSVNLSITDFCHQTGLAYSKPGGGKISERNVAVELISCRKRQTGNVVLVKVLEPDDSRYNFYPVFPQYTR